MLFISCLSYRLYLQRDYPGYLLSRQPWSQGIFIKVTHFFKILLSAVPPLLPAHHKSAHGHRCMKPVPHDSEPSCAVLQQVVGTQSHRFHLELQGQPRHCAAGPYRLHLTPREASLRRSRYFSNTTLPFSFTSTCRLPSQV